MPISSIESYLPTMTGFMEHWTLVNAFLSPGALTLQGGYALIDFTSDKNTLQAAVTAIELLDNAREGAATDRDTKKSSLRGKHVQFRAAVSAHLPGTMYQNMLPTLSPFTANESRFLRPLDDMANLWSRINTDTIPGFTGPLLLPGAFTLANFNTALAALRTAYHTATNTEIDSRAGRGTRDVLLPPDRERMRQYRKAVVATLPAGNALLLSIPALTPPPGSTPDPVALSGQWNSGTVLGDLTWTASANPALLHYSVRTAPGPHYRAADESTIMNVAPGTLSFSTLVGLVAPGATALFRVYVVLTTGNIKGSNTVSITRPV